MNVHNLKSVLVVFAGLFLISTNTLASKSSDHGCSGSCGPTFITKQPLKCSTSGHVCRCPGRFIAATWTLHKHCFGTSNACIYSATLSGSTSSICKSEQASIASLQSKLKQDQNIKWLKQSVFNQDKMSFKQDKKVEWIGFGQKVGFFEDIPWAKRRIGIIN